MEGKDNTSVASAENVMSLITEKAYAYHEGYQAKRVTIATRTRVPHVRSRQEARAWLDNATTIVPVYIDRKVVFFLTLSQ